MTYGTLVASQYGLPMADALLYATAHRHGATVVTSDRDFTELPNTVVL